MMMRTVSVVVILADLLLTVAPTPAPDALPITYYCDSGSFVYDLTKWKNDKILFSYAIAPQSKSLDAIKGATGTTKCIQTFTPIKDVDAEKSLTGCTGIDTDTMQLYLEKTTLLTKFFGSRSFETYRLPCEITGSTKLVTVKNNVLAAATPSSLPTEIPNILNMDVQSARMQAAKNNFFVGEELTVTISTTHTADTYFLRIEDCTAGPGDTVDPSDVRLVTGEVSAQTDIIPINEPLGSPTTPAPATLAPGVTRAPGVTPAPRNTSIHFKMYAFKFFNKSTVYLQCKIKVCRIEHNCFKKTPAGRKRRSAHDKSLDVTTTHFTVHDKDETSSGQTLGCPSLAAFTTFVLLIYRCMV